MNQLKSYHQLGNRGVSLGNGQHPSCLGKDEGQTETPREIAEADGDEDDKPRTNGGHDGLPPPTMGRLVMPKPSLGDVQA